MSFVVKCKLETNHRSIQMLSLQEIREKLKDMNLSAVSRSIGMHRQQLWKLANDESSNPTLQTLERFTEYFKDKK